MSLIPYIYYFVIYSFIGWMIEVVYISVREKKIVNRGFLNGPFTPIYGFGAVSIVLFSDMVTSEWLPVFLFGFFFLSAIEYVTSFMMEKIFGARWWSYYNEPFNLFGRVAFIYSFLWGISSVIFVYLVHPAVELFVSRWSNSTAGMIIIGIIAFYFAADAAFSSIVAQKLCHDLPMDNRQDVTSLIKNLPFVQRRMAMAFPDLISDLMDKWREKSFIIRKK